ncbi:proteasome complex subunit Rpn13 ubiquitin receptor-domain-containing protein [Cunninghamella echinulata]|nr:proteasome complex subunit Rpn13 ubiquitin receptor-domain-containing protein [Cunninghamella echinulata]
MSFFPSAQRPSHLVQFNAGKCIRENNTIKPDLRKGVVYMDQSSDQLMHFYWKERKATEPEEDLIIFPDEAEMVKVEECTTGRVYLLKFKSSNEKLFFWMQNKNDEKDEELVNKVNRLINDPQSVIDEGRSGRMDFSNDSQDLMQILGDSSQDIGMSQENLMQFLQAAGGFGGTVPTSSRLGGDGPIDNQMDVDESTERTEDNRRLSGTQIESIKDILSDITILEDTSSTTATIELSENVKTTSALNPLLKDNDLRSALFPNVPAVNTDRTQDELNELVGSNEFQQSLKKIETAIQSDVLDPIISFLKLGSSPSVSTFLKALEEQAQLRSENNESEAMEH